jgi:hypothetical protein
VIGKGDWALIIFVALVVILAILIFTGLMDHWISDWLWQDDQTPKPR